jgi:hypothetical protein
VCCPLWRTHQKVPNDRSLYQKSDLNIFITFFNGKADAIVYRRIAKDQQISENEVEILLKSNFGGVRCTPPGRAEATYAEYRRQKARGTSRDAIRLPLCA